MITELKGKTMPDGTRYSEYIGLSTDTKPTTNVCNGASFLEMDTGDIYMYDADGEDWVSVA